MKQNVKSCFRNLFYVSIKVAPKYSLNLYFCNDFDKILCLNSDKFEIYRYPMILQNIIEVPAFQCKIYRYFMILQNII